MFKVDDKIRSIKRRELSSVIITTCGICLFGGCIYSYRCNPSVDVSCMRVLCMFIKEWNLLELCIIKTYLTHSMF